MVDYLTIIMNLSIGILALFITEFITMSYSCGGRENCGRKFCPIGLVNDYLLYINIMIAVLLTIDAILIILYISNYF